MAKSKLYVIVVFSLLILSSSLKSQNESEFYGKWKFIKEKSTEIDLYDNLEVEFKQDGKMLMIVQKWGGSRYYADTIRITTNEKANKVLVKNRVFPTNVFMGLSMKVGSSREISAHWEQQGKILKVKEKFTILASQGEFPMTVNHTYVISENKETISYTVSRSSRLEAKPINYLLKKENINNAFFMKLESDWEIDSKLDKQSMLIGLQGLVNRNAANLYFLYPDDWEFNYTPSVFNFYKDKKNFSFKELKTCEQAIKTFREYIKAYVVWDKKERTSLIVAFTVAGLEDALVVSEEMIPMMEKFNIKKVEDFRGKFSGQSDAEIYTWAYNKYWKKCSKDFVLWMGGEHGKVMKPGIADWGISKKAFFNDLSTVQKDTAEYELAEKILSEMNPMSMVMGWHSYKKDKERDHVKLTSKYGHRVEGLNTLPNLSFSSNVPVSQGFVFKNHHNIEAGKVYKPENKVYITCVQTDGLGLGGWTKPGRGEIPYAWEVIMNYSWMAPAMMEYFYTEATPNDYFIGALSGPGYMYPKAIPAEMFPGLLDETNRLMKLLDLKVFEIMDYSEGATVEGNTELTKEVVDAYYKNMPDVIGFINGYAPAYTFTERNKIPLVSFDYYLSPSKTEEDAVTELHELAAINKNRPYFLLVHIREWSDITRVRDILSKLGSEFETVPLDVFLKMAGENPTFKERFLKKE
ncbi:MAG: hypothetical protein K9J13_09430 [Saprospiraceae bacterium]|nr:hypothetical protein [Saprospiraceae bacterium]